MEWLREPEVIDVRDLFLPDRRALLSLLDQLEAADWTRPTVCAGWDVRDVALHVLGVDLGNIAIRRDRQAHLR
ncbi:MAG: maleylpyruvate isomerase N-terminal domain-containing protein, partial [Candidatus Dormibacteraeota bacterium]|nr:maleylpyruvate isomerase N-terminal domain-containing protein [Candidatus Dormibacteraeota bacterium]